MVYLYSTIKMMHGPINLRFTLLLLLLLLLLLIIIIIIIIIRVGEIRTFCFLLQVVLHMPAAVFQTVDIIVYTRHSGALSRKMLSNHTTPISVYVAMLWAGWWPKQQCLTGHRLASTWLLAAYKAVSI